MLFTSCYVSSERNNEITPNILYNPYTEYYMLSQTFFKLYFLRLIKSNSMTSREHVFSHADHKNSTDWAVPTPVFPIITSYNTGKITTYDFVLHGTK